MNILKFSEFNYINEDVVLYELEDFSVSLLESSKVYIPKWIKKSIYRKIKRFYNTPDGYKKGKWTLQINPTHHWFQRLFRKSDPKYIDNEELVNPTKYEGIDLLIDNIDKIISFIQKNDWSKNREPMIEIVNYNAEKEDGEKTMYSVIISVTKKSKRLVNLSLVTQVKGAPLYSKNYKSRRIKSE